MTDYRDLLTRLDEPLPSSGLPLTDLWRRDRKDSAVAIRALIAERAHISDDDVHAVVRAAVLAEREACAKVCDRKATDWAAQVRGPDARWRDAVTAEATAVKLAGLIRARGGRDANT